MNNKVTIYLNGEFTTCPHAIEARLHEIGREDYAQYTDAPYVIYTPKHARKKHTHRKGSRPFIVIVEGWDKDLPPAFMVETAPGIRKSKYLSHSDQYIYDFNKWFEQQRFKVIADYRYTKNTEE